MFVTLLLRICLLLCCYVYVCYRQIPTVRERQHTCPATFQSNYLDVPNVTCDRAFYDNNTFDEGTTSGYPGTVFYTPYNDMSKPRPFEDCCVCCACAELSKVKERSIPIPLLG